MSLHHIIYIFIDIFYHSLITKLNGTLVELSSQYFIELLINISILDSSFFKTFPRREGMALPTL